MPTAIHKPTGRKLNIHVFKDGFARVALYIVGLDDWKEVSRQTRVTVDQAFKTALRGECYIRMNDGTGTPPSLLHSRELEFHP